MSIRLPSRSAEDSKPFTFALRADELLPGTMRRVDVDGVAVAVYHTEAGEFFATQDTCTHAQASLVAGELDGYEVECPLHGARFDLATGSALCLPAFEPLVTYTVRVMNGDIWVCVDRPPTLP